MGDGLVARRPYPPLDASRGLYHYCLRRRHHRTITVRNGAGDGPAPRHRGRNEFENTMEARMRATLVGLVAMLAWAGAITLHAQNTFQFFASLVDAQGEPVATLAPEDLKVA